jgi:hypothetical protein
VFARRDARRDEQARQRAQQSQARAGLLADLAASVRAGEAARIRQSLALFQRDWAAAASGPAAVSASQEQQARELQQRARERLALLQQASHRERLLRLQERAPAIEGLDAAALAQGHREREALLIDLELALGLPSPEHCALERRKRQLEQLQGRFRGGAVPGADAEQLLARWHAVAAATDEGMQRRLARVVDRIVAQKGRAAGASR